MKYLQEYIDKCHEKGHNVAVDLGDKDDGDFLIAVSDVTRDDIKANPENKGIYSLLFLFHSTLLLYSNSDSIEEQSSNCVIVGNVLDWIIDHKKAFNDTLKAWYYKSQYIRTIPEDFESKDIDEEFCEIYPNFLISMTDHELTSRYFVKKFKEYYPDEYERVFGKEE